MIKVIAAREKLKRACLKSITFGNFMAIKWSQNRKYILWLSKDKKILKLHIDKFC